LTKGEKEFSYKWLNKNHTDKSADSFFATMHPSLASIFIHSG